ncbi:Hint domain-containing protein [Nereida sp. MMG025]|uniref:Hint domain-containing protein n=1 Tax=Nereida sp. MMG025 TaxID=2909981 RepID=UPI001F4695AC|nr:Hint domain-containing protein [Nereida sp. MMG025]MCF6444536.1 Hint domain-containing protein [Nereida sp. MMG025]
MPTNYTDQFLLIDPFSPPPVGTTMNVVNYTLTDQDDDNDIGAAGGDSVNGLDVTASYPGDTVTLNVPGVGNVTYTGITFYLAGGGRAFTPTDGQVLQTGTLVNANWEPTSIPLDVGDLGPPCFVAGTFIATPQGERRIEDLEIGDLVTLADGTAAPVLWTAQKRVDATANFAPIRFAADAIGNTEPLLLSPNHRVLITGWRAELLMGQSEVLVAAKHLVDGDRICRVPQRDVVYHHILLPEHSVIFSNGAKTESLFLGDVVAGADAETRTELTTLYPELVAQADARGWCAARMVAKSYEAGALLAA